MSDEFRVLAAVISSFDATCACAVFPEDSVRMAESTDFPFEVEHVDSSGASKAPL